MYASRLFIIGFLSIGGIALSLPVAQADSIQNFAAQRRAERLSQAGNSSVSSQSSSSVVSSPVLTAHDQALMSEEDERISAVEHANPAVVSVIISKDLPVLKQSYKDIPLGNGMTMRVPQTIQNGTSSQVVGGGTAFFVSANGLLMTNNHVVSDTTAQYTVLLNTGEQLSATVVKRDATNDIALIQVTKRSTPFLTFADNADIHLAQTAIAIGNALGDYRNTVSVGVVSGLDRSISASTENNGSETLSAIIQTDAAINQGNSGGPLLNLKGQVIGMNTAIAIQAQNIGFAIPVSALRTMLNGYRQ